MKNPYSKKGKSLLFTCQNIKSLEVLEKEGRFFNKKEYIEKHLEDITPMIIRSYDWFVEAAQKRIKKPDDVNYQVWCAVSADACMRPTENEVVYILEVPDEEIIYFSGAKWDYVINMHYVPTDDEDYDRYIKDIESKGFANSYEFIIGRYAGKYLQEEKRIRDSWIRVFDIDRWNVREVQANLWEIKKEWIKHIVRYGEKIPKEYYFND